MASASTSAAFPADGIYHVNPYAGHPDLTPSAAELLWELAKVNQRVSDVRAFFLQAPPGRRLASLQDGPNVQPVSI